MAETRRRRSIAWLFILLGGAAVIAGAFLPWLDTGGVTVGTETVTGKPAGLDLTYGTAALVAGAAIAVFGLLMLVWPGPTRLWGAGALLGGGVAVAMGVLTLTGIRDVYISFVGSELGRASAEIENSLGALFDNGGISERVALGVYVVIAGGAVALLAGLVALLRGRPAGAIPTPDVAELAGPEATTTPPEMADEDVAVPSEETPPPAEPAVPAEAVTQHPDEVEQAQEDAGEASLDEGEAGPPTVDPMDQQGVGEVEVAGSTPTDERPLPAPPETPQQAETREDPPDVEEWR